MSILDLYLRRKAAEKEEAVEFFYDRPRVVNKNKQIEQGQPPYQELEGPTWPVTEFDPEYPPQLPEGAQEIDEGVYEAPHPYDPSKQLTFSPEESKMALHQNMITNLSGGDFDEYEETMQVLGYDPGTTYPVGQSRGVDGQAYFMNDGTVLKVSTDAEGGGEDVMAMERMVQLGRLPGTAQIHEVIILPTFDVAIKMDHGGYPIAGFLPKEYTSHMGMTDRVPGLKEAGEAAGVPQIAQLIDRWYDGVHRSYMELYSGKISENTFKRWCLFELPEVLMEDVRLEPEQMQMARQFFQDLQQLSMLGIEQWTDAHLGNVLYDPKNNKLNIIDFSRADFSELENMLDLVQEEIRTKQRTAMLWVEAGKKEQIERMKKLMRQWNIPWRSEEELRKKAEMAWDKLRSYDPTGRKYIDQMITWMKPFSSQPDADWLHNTRSALADYDRFKKQLRPEERNLAMYSTPSDLQEVMLRFDTEDKRYRQVIEEAGEDAIEIVDKGEDYTIYEIKDPQASHIMGKGSHWCIRLPDGTWAEEYLERGPVHMVYKDGKPFVASGIDDKGSWGVFDIDDTHAGNLDSANINTEDEREVEIFNHAYQTITENEDVQEKGQGKVCYKCDEAISGEAYTVEGETYCEDCVPNECQQCGEMVDNEDTYFEDDGPYCAECHGEIFVCQICKRSIGAYGVAEFSSDGLCKTCAQVKQCEMCLEEIPNHQIEAQTKGRYGGGELEYYIVNHMHVEPGFSGICEECLDETEICEDCGERKDREGGVVSKAYNTFQCEDCKASCESCGEDVPNDETTTFPMEYPILPHAVVGQEYEVCEECWGKLSDMEYEYEERMQQQQTQPPQVTPPPSTMAYHKQCVSCGNPADESGLCQQCLGIQSYARKQDSIFDAWYRRATEQDRSLTYRLLLNAVNNIFSYEWPPHPFGEAIAQLSVLQDHLAEKGMEAMPGVHVPSQIFQLANTEGIEEMAAQQPDRIVSSEINPSSDVPFRLMALLQAFHEEQPLERVNAAITELIQALQFDMQQGSPHPSGGMTGQFPHPDDLATIVDFGSQIATEGGLSADGVAAWSWARLQENQHMQVQTRLSEPIDFVVVDRRTGEEIARIEVDEDAMYYGEEELIQEMDYNGELPFDEDIGFLAGQFEQSQQPAHWQAQLTAPGYMDQTEWVDAPEDNNTETGAIIELYHLFGE